RRRPRQGREARPGKARRPAGHRTADSAARRRKRAARHRRRSRRNHCPRPRRDDPPGRRFGAFRRRHPPVMNAAGDAAPFLFIIAGEPSGDALGAALVAALRERTGGHLRVAGIGGGAMAAQGVESLVPLADVAVAGVAEVLPRAPLILRRVRETVAAIRTMRPDAVVTIDSSGFSW